jgi:hypothetical protein
VSTPVFFKCQGHEKQGDIKELSETLFERHYLENTQHKKGLVGWLN